jgi:hypothetical protein
METRNVKISLETAQRWHNSTNNELKELAVQTYPEIAKKELPKSWEDLDKIDGYYVSNQSNVFNVKINEIQNAERNIFATKEQAEASLAMAQLSQLMKVYNDGWEPDYSVNKNKYYIFFIKNEIIKGTDFYYQNFLSFKDEETRDLFLENFRELIETAKPLL